jgi:hypothetical protein
MSLIRNRRHFLSALFSALLALALFDHGAATAQEAKQIKLTEKHIQGFMAAYEDIAKLYYDANPDTPEDPKVEGAGRGCRQEEQKSVLLAKQRTRGDFSCSCGCLRSSHLIGTSKPRPPCRGFFLPGHSVSLRFNTSNLSHLWRRLNVEAVMRPTRRAGLWPALDQSWRILR